VVGFKCSLEGGAGRGPSGKEHAAWDETLHKSRISAAHCCLTLAKEKHSLRKKNSHVSAGSFRAGPDDAQPYTERDVNKTVAGGNISDVNEWATVNG